MQQPTREFVWDLPKAELHLHIEGTLEPELKLKLAARNHIDLPESNIEDIRASYKFSDLPSFLAVYYKGMECLIHEEDFYDLAWEYLKRAKANNVRHVEMFFDPQAHTSRGIAFSTVIEGLLRAIEDAKALGVDARLVMCFLRDFSAESARQTIEAALPYKDNIIGVGLDSDEHNNPPMKFFNIFARARELGWHVTAHADVDQVDSISHIKELLEVIESERIDHGTNLVEDSDLVSYASAQHTGLTSCPISNSFCSGGDMKTKEVRELLNSGVQVCINSDDPAYFGGYVSDNIWAFAEHEHASIETLALLCKNSFKMSWISDVQKELWCQEVDNFVAAFSQAQ